jgi:hypothetical protein
MMNEGPLGENDEKMMREKARTSGFISDFTRCMNDALLTRANYFQMVGSRLYWDLYAEGMLRYDYQTASSVSDVNDESRCSLPAADSTERTPFAAGNIADVDWRSQQDTVVTKRRRVTRS